MKRKPPNYPTTDPFWFLTPLFDAYAAPNRIQYIENERMNPILASLQDLPKDMLFLIATVDILLDEQLEMVEQLQKEIEATQQKGERRVEKVMFEGQWHGWDQCAYSASMNSLQREQALMMTLKYPPSLSTHRLERKLTRLLAALSKKCIEGMGFLGHGLEASFLYNYDKTSSLSSLPAILYQYYNLSHYASQVRPAIIGEVLHCVWSLSPLTNAMMQYLPRSHILDPPSLTQNNVDLPASFSLQDPSDLCQISMSGVTDKLQCNRRQLGRTTWGGLRLQESRETPERRGPDPE